MRTRDCLAFIVGLGACLFAEAVDDWLRRPERIWARLHRRLAR